MEVESATLADVVCILGFLVTPTSDLICRLWKYFEMPKNLYAVQPVGFLKTYTSDDITYKTIAVILHILTIASNPWIWGLSCCGCKSACRASVCSFSQQLFRATEIRVLTKSSVSKPKNVIHSSEPKTDITHHIEGVIIFEYDFTGVVLDDICRRRMLKDQFG